MPAVGRLAQKLINTSVELGVMQACLRWPPADRYISLAMVEQVQANVIDIIVMIVQVPREQQALHVFAWICGVCMPGLNKTFFFLDGWLQESLESTSECNVPYRTVPYLIRYGT